MDFTIDSAKSYATEANLLVALKKHKLDAATYTVVRNRAGRWTAIFGLSSRGTDPVFHGFMVIN